MRILTTAHSPKVRFFRDPAIIILLSLAWMLVFALVNRQYGFHRDELAFLDNARHLAWGYVEYPPLTPWIARLALDLFGPSLAGLRSFAALAVLAALALSGLMVGELGGSRKAQALAALLVAIAPIVLSHASFFSYETFDYLWWVLVAYGMLRLLKSDDPRWWLVIGAAIGLGMMTKYTMAFCVAGVVAGVVFTPARRYLKSPWLWAGAVLSLLIFLPNLLWQVQHHFISLEFLGSIHTRDLRIGRTNTLQFLISQVYICANPAAIGMWIGGLRFYGSSPVDRRYRALAWMFAVPFVLFLVTQGRFYYLAPAYPMLIAAGVYRFERARIEARTPMTASNGGLPARPPVPLYSGIVVGGVIAAALALPLAPVNSGWWNLAHAANAELGEQIGWPELVRTVAGIRDTLPAEDRLRFGVLTGNYGEAGAVNLYGSAFGLPQAISGIDSYWLRGYGDPPPEVLVVVGLPLSYIGSHFESCTLAGHSSNPYGLLNEETRDHPDILLCRRLLEPWPVFWQSMQSFG